MYTINFKATTKITQKVVYNKPTKNIKSNYKTTQKAEKEEKGNKEQMEQIGKKQQCSRLIITLSLNWSTHTN